MKKIGIIRGLMPRLTQAEFAASFSHLDPVFITGESGKEIASYCKENGVVQRDLSLIPLFLRDPFQLVLRRRVHQSWIGVSGLAAACRDVDVLETYELYHLFSGQAATVSKKLQIPLVCEVWTSFAKHPAYLLPPYRWNVQKVIKQTSLFIARSEKAASALRQLSVPEEKIRMIYHGVNIDRFRPSKKNPTMPVRILFVGELTAYKGVSMILAVWPKVREKFPDAELVLVGKGPLFDQAKKTSGVSAVGYVSHTKLSAVYASCDIFVSPSQDRYLGPLLWWEEFFSYTLMEALAAGLPIIATRSGGIPEEIGEENWLIPQRDPQALLQALLDACSDSVRRGKLREKNRHRAETHFDLKKQTAILEKEIQKLRI